MNTNREGHSDVIQQKVAWDIMQQFFGHPGCNVLSSYFPNWAY